MIQFTISNYDLTRRSRLSRKAHLLLEHNPYRTPFQKTGSYVERLNAAHTLGHGLSVWPLLTGSYVECLLPLTHWIIQKQFQDHIFPLKQVLSNSFHKISFSLTMQNTIQYIEYTACFKIVGLSVMNESMHI